MSHKRNRMSSIDRLDPQVRELIGKLRRDHGCTIDEILAKLHELEVKVSRSALGRHIKTEIDEVGERMRRSREMALALVDRFGAEPDNRLARLNLELMHGVVMRTITATAADPETGELKPVTFSAGDAMFLAKALSELSRAAKTDAERIVKEREAATKEAAEKAGAAAKARGLSAETVDFITTAVLGAAA